MCPNFWGGFKASLNEIKSWSSEGNQKRKGKEKETNGENSGPLTSLPVDCLTAH